LQYVYGIEYVAVMIKVKVFYQKSFCIFCTVSEVSSSLFWLKQSEWQWRFKFLLN